jgi:hypothetical protein
MKNVLLASNLGAYAHGIGFDSYLYQLLKKNNFNARLMLCDGIIDACQMSKFSRTLPEKLSVTGQGEFCKKCIKQGNLRSQLVNDKFYLSNYLSDIEKNKAEKISKTIHTDDIPQYTIDSINLGEQANASAIRYFASLQLNKEKFGESVLRKYLSGAIKVYFAYKNFFDKHPIDVVIIHHGIYSPQGIILQLAKSKKIKVVTWIKTYRKNTFLFSWDDSYHFTMQKIHSNWSSFNFNNLAYRRAINYLNERKTGASDSIHFNPNPIDFKLKPSKTKKVLLLTSVFWDAQLHYKGNLFGDQASWLLETINFFNNHPEHGELIIRVHPAETSGFVPSRDKAIDRINSKFKKLSKNISIFDSTSKISTYSLIEQSNLIVVYNTKASIEALAMGKQVLVAGDAWVKSLDFTICPPNEKEYFDILSIKEFKDLSYTRQKMALRFFYYFYFRRMFVFDEFDDDIKKTGKGSFVFNPLERNSRKISYQERSEAAFINSLNFNSEFIFQDENFLNDIDIKDKYD